MTQEVLTALDGLVRDSRKADLPPTELIRIQTGIAAWRYTLAGLVATAEGQAMQAKHSYDLYILRERLSLQAEQPKLAHNKASDEVEKRPAAEEWYQMHVRAQVEYKGLKLKLDTSGDVLVSLAQRLKRAENQMIEARMQTNHS